jgi:hypothetical protein
LGLNKTQFWKDILPEVVAVKKSSIAVASTTFQNKPHFAVTSSKNVLKLVNTPFEKKPQFAVKSNKNVIKLFNTTFLTKNQSDSKAPRALRLHSDLLGFQKFYNQHGDIGYSVLRYGKIREKPGIYYCCISIYKFPRTYVQLKQETTEIIRCVLFNYILNVSVSLVQRILF